MSDSESEGEKSSLRAPVFNDDWGMFKAMFLNYGRCQGFGSVIVMDSPDPNLPDAEDEMTPDPQIKKKQKSCVQKNRMAINALFIAFRKRPSLLQLVLNTRNLKWPNGRAWIAMKKLELKFNPQHNVTMLDAEKAIDDAKMKTGESPSDFHDRLCSIQRRYPNQLTDHGIRNAMMRKSSPQYRDVIIQSLKKPNLSADELMYDMQHVFRTMQSLNFEDTAQDETEVALVQPANRPNSSPTRSANEYLSTMRCFICNQTRHKMQDCPLKHMRNTIKCVHCGRTSHTHNRCWHLPANAANRPEWYTPHNTTKPSVPQVVTAPNPVPVVVPPAQEEKPDVGLAAYDYAFVSISDGELMAHNDDGSHDSGSLLLEKMLEVDESREDSVAAAEDIDEVMEAVAYGNGDEDDAMNDGEDADSFPSVHNSDEMQQVMRDIAYGAGESEWSDDDVPDDDESFSTATGTLGSEEYCLGSDFDDEDDVLVQLQEDVHDEDDLIQLQDEPKDQEDETSPSLNRASQLLVVGEVSSGDLDHLVEEVTVAKGDSNQLAVDVKDKDRNVPESIDLVDLASDSDDSSVEYIKTVKFPDLHETVPGVTAPCAVE